jgi:RNA polymerase sigma factor (sigma-70 family)
MVAGDDDALLAGVSAGDPDWAELYRRHRDAMYATARRFLRTHETARGGVSAEDVVQQAMTEIMDNGLPRDIATRARLRSYFVKAAFGRAYNAVYRAAGRGVPLPERGSRGELPSEEQFEEAVEDQALADQAKALVSQLPADQGQVMTDHVMHARTQAHVAAEMGLSDGRIRQLRNDAIRGIRDQMGGGPPANENDMRGGRRDGKE